MRNTFILCALLALGSYSFAQQPERFPLGEYQELADPKPHDSDEAWDQLSVPTRLSWGSTDIRYTKHDIPDVKISDRWRGKASL